MYVHAIITQSLSSRSARALMIGLYWGNCRSNMFFHQYQTFVLVVVSRFSSTSCIVPELHLYQTNTEFAHWEAILRKLNIIWIQKKIQTIVIKIRGIILGLVSLSFCKILSQNIASVIIVQDINTVPYRRIDDQIIHQIHHQINVVNAIEVRILSFLAIAYGNAMSKNTYTIIQKNPISV